MHPTPVDDLSADTIGDLHRQLTLLTDLARRLDDAVAHMPQADAGALWWGPAREAVQVALDIERERLRREALRARGAADQVRIRLHEAGEALPVALP